MKYTRPLQREEIKNEFSIGSHPATIKKVKNMFSKNTGAPMFRMLVTGENEEEATHYLVFGNSYTESNVNFLLASIEDNGVDIPDIDFGFNPETLNFLKGKAVYIEIKETEYKGSKQNSIDKFLNLKEFEESDTSTEDSGVYDGWED